MIKGICNPIFLFFPAQEMILGNENHIIKVEDTRFQRTPRNLGSRGDVYEHNGQLYGGSILVHPYSCARIVATAIVSSNRTTFVKAPRYKEASRDEKQRDGQTKRKKSSTTAIVPDPISISTTTIAIVTRSEERRVGKECRL